MCTNAMWLAGVALAAGGRQACQAMAIVDWLLALNARQQRLHFFSALMQPDSSTRGHHRIGVPSQLLATHAPTLEARHKRQYSK